MGFPTNADRWVAVGSRGARVRSRSGWWIALWVTLSVGIYIAVWYYRFNKGLRTIGRTNPAPLNESLRSSRPGRSLLAITVGCLLLVPPFVSMWRTTNRAKQAMLTLEEPPPYPDPAVATVVFGVLMYILAVPFFDVGAVAPGLPWLVAAVLFFGSTLLYAAYPIYLQGHVSRALAALPSAPSPASERPPRKRTALAAAVLGVPMTLVWAAWLAGLLRPWFDEKVWEQDLLVTPGEVFAITTIPLLVLIVTLGVLGRGWKFDGHARYAAVAPLVVPALVTAYMILGFYGLLATTAGCPMESYVCEPLDQWAAMWRGPINGR
jgi:hypothetical protein